MPNKVTERIRLRRDYSKFEKIHEVPNLIDVQWQSYQRFLQPNVEKDKREDFGLHAVFKSVFPIKDYNDTASLEFVSYEFGEPKYDIRECQQRGMTWASPLKVTVQLVLWDDSAGEKQIRDIKEQEVYFGEIPLMTPTGTFIVNGSERVIVSQLHRSPGVFFAHDKGKSHSSGKLLYNARIIPYRGSWLDLEFDIKDILHVRIDRRRKQPASVLLRALGLTTEQILKRFYKSDIVNLHDDGSLSKMFIPDQLDGLRALEELKAKDGKVLVKEGQKFNRAVIRRMTEAKTKNVKISPDSVEGFVSAKTIAVAKEDVLAMNGKKVIIPQDHVLVGWQEIFDTFDKAGKEEPEHEYLKKELEKIEVILGAGEYFQPEVFDAKGKLKIEGTVSKLKEIGFEQIEVLYLKENHIGESLIKTLIADGVEPEKDDLFSTFIGTPRLSALIEVYKHLRPGDPPRVETAETNFQNLFFNPERYDLSPVGRLKLDYKLYGGEKTKITKEQRFKKTKHKESGSEFIDGATLAHEDLIGVISYILNLRNGVDPQNCTIDDIDHLGNRRVRSSGELVENQYRIGLVRMERAIKERMSIQDIETLMPQDLINYKPVAAAIKEFFGSSQLSQFMDQTNPLSEITHKRRLSALGPGGLTRERAGFEVRDVHPTHYGRVCPIETPEGPNIGLISSMATYARVNTYGFVETPYRVVKDGRVTDEFRYLSAIEESKEVIAQGSSKLDDKGDFVESLVAARKSNEFTLLTPEEVTMMDVSPSQLVSVAASLIPFLENDDANRALMGSNMQRQAVPLLKTTAPLVGTGSEKIVARDSGAALLAKRDGIVQAVDATRIVIKSDKITSDPLDTGVDIYNLSKYQRSNQNTCINQHSIVRFGDKIKKGDVIADGQSTDMGELALGRNILVAFMSWGGYNFEDSILVSEKLVREDAFTSIHIEEFECIARDTKLGNEEITRDIPNVGEDALSNLDESGIVRIGAEVRPGDILVGKITPKSESQLSPEEKLLRAIFGEKAGEVRDTSMRLSPGVEGTVISAHVFSRKGTSKDERMLEIEKKEIARLEQDQRDEIRILRESALNQLVSMLEGQKTSNKLSDENKRQLIAKGETITKEMLESLPFEYLRDIKVGDAKTESETNRIVVGTSQLINNKRTAVGNKIKRLKKGDELPPGVIKMVKVFVAVKRRLQVGDKMAGRHGNKGVLSVVLPVEDMPYLPDGTPVDMVLNPLGVPSRMNVGQVLETHLGWVSYSLGQKFRGLLDKVCDSNVRLTDKVYKDTSFAEGFDDVAKEIKGTFTKTFKEEDKAAFISSLDDKEVVQLAQKSMSGIHVASPVFEGVSEGEMLELAEAAGYEPNLECTQTELFDGKSGEKFSEKVTVGVMYMLKLHHLVDNKIHARSIGPYSLVTQQPLGGKAQFGGQRLGEMEVWALEAYGAAYALQEFLTVKSDDVAGRTRMYEAIVKGENILEPGLPESFNVMCKELMSLGLDIELIEDQNAEDQITEENTEESGTGKMPKIGMIAKTSDSKDVGESIQNG